MASVRSSLSASSARFQLILVLPLCFSFLARVDAVNVTIQNEEVRALLSFRQANNGSLYGGHWLTWKETDETPCGWIGVLCTASYTVEELDLSGWRTILHSIEALHNLADLRHLDLSYNYLFLPNDIGKFAGLLRLGLSQVGLFGLPPRISGCRNLHFLSLDQNQFTALPPGLSDLRNLQYLSLAQNDLTGPFPTEELGNISSLVTLNLFGNSFDGSIPSLPNLTNLAELWLDYNNFTEFEEPWFLGGKSLQHLSISNNHLEGTIPSIITSFLHLSTLDMSGNYLVGKIPSGFSAQNDYGFSLDLSRNQLTGEIPTDMLQQTNRNVCGAIVYRNVNVSYNLLTGDIPTDRSKVLCFDSLDLSHNNLSGPFPSNMFSRADSVILTLWLNNNNFSGDIVDVLFGSSLYAMVELRLANNHLTGNLSRLANIGLEVGKLAILDLSNNHLQWSTSEAIPDPIKVTLEVLTSHSALGQFLVGGNNFSGTYLPGACFVNSTSSLTVLDLSNSHLQGEILGAAFNDTCLPSIQVLNLSNNYATGPLLGSIVPDHRDFVVDVSNNHLSGRLPRILQSSNLYNPRYFIGNDGLCGDPLPPCSNMQATHVQWWVLLITIGGSVTIAMGSCLAATWRWRVYQKRHQQDADLIKTLLERESATLMPLRELKKATSNFAESAQIGEGGFGIVYVGKLNDGSTVAIKRRKREGSDKDKKQFLNEVRILSQVNHRHLVKLLGCCMENRTAVLVFEFVSNGTLQEHLQGKFGAGHLSWKQRLTIAVQTADALNYLHSAATSPIFHRDVKSANILLNENLDAKVADFGISKFAPLQATHVTTMAVQGTMGYIDPEYYTSYQLTDRSDVYSYGVVLLELISAKPALDFSRVGDETSLVNLASPYIGRGDLEELIDPILLETYSDMTGHGRESILKVGRLAMKCLDMHSKARPSMRAVLKELHNFWLEFVATSKHLDSINEDDDEDLQGDSKVLLSRSFSSDSSSLTIQCDGSGIEMSHFSPHPRFSSPSMGY